jgi:predicted RNA-binding Zn-ribbon protein involved in translation (DUF1610 family)
MQEPEFWDFVMEGGYDLLFPDDEDKEFECPHCQTVIAGSEKVEWIDRKKRVFKCPECEEEISLE